MVYPALLPLMRTPQLPVVDWTDAPADLNGLVRFPERRDVVSARVPSHFKCSLIHAVIYSVQHVRFQVSVRHAASIFTVYLLNIQSSRPKRWNKLNDLKRSRKPEDRSFGITCHDDPKLVNLKQWRTQEFCSGGGFNKFSWGQRTERTGIWWRSPPS